jgi:inhibitor of KinA
MTFVRYGPNALLFRFADTVSERSLVKCSAIAADLERDPPSGLLEFVPAFTTILLIFDRDTQPAQFGETLRERFTRCPESYLPNANSIEIPVVYDGPDLDRVAELNKLTRQEVIELHSSRTYRVHVLGFSPGFPYLSELDPKLHTPRLANPRPRVAAGSVAIGGEHTGIYSVDSPGGWNIIGHTSVKLFNSHASDADGMFLLQRGDRVRFVQSL